MQVVEDFEMVWEPLLLPAVARNAVCKVKNQFLVVMSGQSAASLAASSNLPSWNL